jgi:hypothetical protein
MRKKLFYNLRKEEETINNVTVKEIAEHFKCSECNIRVLFSNNEEKIFGYNYELTDECKNTKYKEIPEYLLTEWEEVRKMFNGKGKNE